MKARIVAAWRALLIPAAQRRALAKRRLERLLRGEGLSHSQARRVTRAFYTQDEFR